MYILNTDRKWNSEKRQGKSIRIIYTEELVEDYYVELIQIINEDISLKCLYDWGWIESPHLNKFKNVAELYLFWYDIFSPLKSKLFINFLKSAIAYHRTYIIDQIVNNY